MNANLSPVASAIVTLKSATFDDVDTFRAAARRVGKSLETAKNVTGDIVGALFRLSAGLTPADAGARVHALYTKVYADVAKANAGGASSYRTISKVFKDMAASGMTLPLPVYESVGAAKKAYEAHANNLPANVEAAARASAEAEAEEEEAMATISAATLQLDNLKAIASHARVLLSLPDGATIADILAAITLATAPANAKATAAATAATSKALEASKAKGKETAKA